MFLAQLLAVGLLTGSGGSFVPPEPVIDQIEYLGGGGKVQRQKLDKDSYLYRLLSPLPDLTAPEQARAAEVIEQVAKAAVSQPASAEADDLQATMRDYGMAYREAYGEIYRQFVAEMRERQAIQAQQDEDAAIAQVIALLL